MNISQRSLFLKHVAQTSPFPPMLEIAEANGCYIKDIDGKSYLDFIAGISVSNLGHRHPKVIDAIKHQLDRYLHVMVYGEFIQSPQVDLANCLATMLPGELNNVFFTNSGTETIEGAIKLAKRHSGRTEIISFVNAYHGSTHGALSIMGSELLKTEYRPLVPDNRLISYNNFEDLEQISRKTAAVVVEIIQGEAGAVKGDLEWLIALQNRCIELDVLLIADEIQTGFGRTGACFASKHFGLRPDIITMAKGMGGGLPIGAFAAKQSVMSDLSHNPLLGNLSTFGGNALCCSAALAVANEIKDSNIVADVIPKSERILSNLQHTDIIEVRGMGLLLAMRLKSNERVLKVMNACYEIGLITDWFLFADDCIRIAPPLIISNEEIDKGCEILLDALKRTA
jgi:acetylornithine/succinyldiaminopimelate/putrescine aminotransferase